MRQSLVHHQGLVYVLESAETMSVHVWHSHESRYTEKPLLHWNEADGFTIYATDGTQSDFPHGGSIVRAGRTFTLLEEKQAERVIECLRTLGGMVY